MNNDEISKAFGFNGQYPEIFPFGGVPSPFTYAGIDVSAQTMDRLMGLGCARNDLTAQFGIPQDMMAGQLGTFAEQGFAQARARQSFDFAGIGAAQQQAHERYVREACYNQTPNFKCTKVDKKNRTVELRTENSRPRLIKRIWNRVRNWIERPRVPRKTRRDMRCADQRWMDDRAVIVAKAIQESIDDLSWRRAA